MNDTIGWPCHHKIAPSDRSGCRDYDPNHHSKEALTHFVSAPWCPKTTMFSFSGKNGGEKQNRSYLEITRAFGWNLEVNFQLPWWGVPHQTPRLTRIVAKPKALLSRHFQKSAKLSSSQVLALVFKHAIFESTHGYTLNILKKYKWNFPAKFPMGEKCVKSKDGSKWFQLRNREVSTGLILCQPGPGSFCKSPFTKKTIYKHMFNKNIRS